jgi:hypothetical protein
MLQWSVRDNCKSQRARLISAISLSEANNLRGAVGGTIAAGQRPEVHPGGIDTLSPVKT